MIGEGVETEEQKKQMLEIGLENATIYLNVSAHTIMHPEFSSIFSNFVNEMGFLSLIHISEPTRPY